MLSSKAAAFSVDALLKDKISHPPVNVEKLTINKEQPNALQNYHSVVSKYNFTKEYLQHVNSEMPNSLTRLNENVSENERITNSFPNTSTTEALSTELNCGGTIASRLVHRKGSADLPFHTRTSLTQEQQIHIQSDIFSSNSSSNYEQCYDKRRKLNAEILQSNASNPREIINKGNKNTLLKLKLLNKQKKHIHNKPDEATDVKITNVDFPRGGLPSISTIVDNSRQSTKTFLSPHPEGM